MSALVRYWRRATRASRIHMSLTFVWLGLTYPTVTIWRGSVLVVLLYSVYANICTHWGAYEAAKAKEAQQDRQADQNG